VAPTVAVDRRNSIELPTLSKPATSAELAGIFGVSERTIQRRIKKGTLPAKPDGRKWRVPLNVLPAEYVQKAIQK